MNKPLLLTAALMSAALVAGAVVDADNICNRLFIMDVGNLQPGTLVIVKVEEARNQ